MREHGWAWILAATLAACGGASASSETTTEETATEETSGEDTAANDEQTPPEDPGPQPGSPECEGCTYAETPGHVDSSGAGGIARFCTRASTETAGPMCPRSCCPEMTE